MIAVCIATYNHEAFIAEAIESVLSQVCDEPMRVYIGDDASTDATETVCEQYAQQDERIVRRFDRFVVLTHEDAGYWGNLENLIVIPNAALNLPVHPADGRRKDGSAIYVSKFVYPLYMMPLFMMSLLL